MKTTLIHTSFVVVLASVLGSGDSVGFAAAPSGESILSIANQEELFGSTKDEMLDNIGIGMMVKKIMKQSPIKKLADEVNKSNTKGESGRMGARLRAVMKESSFFDLSTLGEGEVFEFGDIYGGNEPENSELDADNEAMQLGTMYPARLVVDFSAFPTHQSDPVFMDSRIRRFNELITRRFNETGRGNIRLRRIEAVHHLQGTVFSRDDKDVLEIMLRMEPGVDEIFNEIQVVEKPSQSQPLSTLPSPNSALDFQQIRGDN